MMVESEAKELSEEVMLGAVMFGHMRLPAGDRRMIIRLAEKAAKEPRDFVPVGQFRARSQGARHGRRRDRQGLHHHRQDGARRPLSEAKATSCQAELFATGQS
jgi:polyribonucleotide nucleotidyltransferase